MLSNTCTYSFPVKHRCCVRIIAPSPPDVKEGIIQFPIPGFAFVKVSRRTVGLCASHCALPHYINNKTVDLQQQRTPLCITAARLMQRHHHVFHHVTPPPDCTSHTTQKQFFTVIIIMLTGCFSNFNFNGFN